MQTNFMMNRKSLFLCFLLVVGFMLAITPAARAQDKPLIVEPNTGTDEELALRHQLTLKVTNLPEWLKQPGNDLSQLILYVDGMALKSLKPALIEDNKLLFDVRRTDENKDVWTILLSRKRDNFFYRNVPVTLGFENGVQVQSNVRLKLTIINQTWLFIFVFIFVLALGLFWWLAIKSDIIRDTGPQPQTRTVGKSNRKPYSLARTQMALWFFTIIISYVFIWIVTSDLSSLTSTVVGLMGISAATGLGATVVDSSKLSEKKNQKQVLEEKRDDDQVEVTQLQSEIQLQEANIPTLSSADLREQEAALAAKRAELAAKEKMIGQVDTKINDLDVSVKPTASKYFLKDILSDDNGVSFHRFQIFAWTIALIVIFVSQVYDTLAMPIFDATLLALMGISGATFIGFKLPEQQG